MSLISGFCRFQEGDPCVDCVLYSTEEGKKVARQGGDNKEGKKFLAVFRRIADPALAMETD